MTNIGLEGLDKLKLKLKHLTGIISDRELENRYLESAKVIRDTAKSKAPIAKKGHWSKKGRAGTQYWIEPGSLQRGIVAKLFKGKSKHPPAAFCAIDYSIAPHAHLVEYGARGGQMPAQPYFRPAIDGSKNQIRSIIKNGLKKAILRTAKR